MVIAAFLYACSPVTEDLEPALKVNPGTTSTNTPPNTPLEIPCSFPRADSLYMNYFMSSTILPPPQKEFMVGYASEYGDGYRITAYSTDDIVYLTFYNGNSQPSKPIEGTYTTTEDFANRWRVKINGNFGGSSFNYYAFSNQKVYVKNSTTPGRVEVYFCGINNRWQAFSNVGNITINGKVELTL